jgi:hypothetical protein
MFYVLILELGSSFHKILGSKMNNHNPELGEGIGTSPSLVRPKVTIGQP